MNGMVKLHMLNAEKRSYCKAQKVTGFLVQV